jgi:hypothetical protein
MKNFPLNKYHFYETKNKVIATSTYAGKRVRGVAVCHPEDEFNYETGQKIAAARCTYKVSVKRYNRAVTKYAEAMIKLSEAQAYVDHMKEYMDDSYIAMNEAAQEHDILIASLANK